MMDLATAAARSSHATRNVVLTEHDADVIDRLLKSGRYQNASEVLGEGLRLVERREEAEASKLEALQKAARLGFADLEEGRFTDIADDELEDAIATLGREAEAKVSKATRLRSGLIAPLTPHLQN